MIEECRIEEDDFDEQFEEHDLAIKIYVSKTGGIGVKSVLQDDPVLVEDLLRAMEAAFGRFLRIKRGEAADEFH